MKRQEAVEKLNVLLTAVIDKWMNDTAETEEDAWDPIGYIGDELSRLMAKAAIAVMESSADVQDSLKQNGELND